VRRMECKDLPLRSIGRLDPGCRPEVSEGSARVCGRTLLSGSVGTVAGKAHSAKTFAHLLGVMYEALAEFDDAIVSRECQLKRHKIARRFLNRVRRFDSCRGHEPMSCSG
jgi:hypothetical protein